jgi:hypothetical protein
MDARHFDSLARRLSGGLTRRGLVAILGALTGTGSLAICGRHMAEAKRRKKRKKKRCSPNCAGKTCGDNGCRGSCGTCGASQQCCNGACIPSTQCCNGTCGPGFACCANSCVNLATDPNNCGFCGRACADGGCVHGACTCNGGTTTCPCTSPTCNARLQGSPPACTEGPATTDCSTDDGCPLGSVCLTNSKCSVPCT